MQRKQGKEKSNQRVYSGGDLIKTSFDISLININKLFKTMQNYIHNMRYCLSLELLEGAAHYTGLLLAPAEGFGLPPVLAQILVIFGDQ